MFNQLVLEPLKLMEIQWQAIHGRENLKVAST